MPQPEIEYSNCRREFSDAEIREKVRASEAYWASPAGVRRKAELDREARNRKPAPTKFPYLAARGTRPALSYLTPADQALLAKFI